MFLSKASVVVPDLGSEGEDGGLLGGAQAALYRAGAESLALARTDPEPGPG